jgi:hypothetical protein
MLSRKGNLLLFVYYTFISIITIIMPLVIITSDVLVPILTGGNIILSSAYSNVWTLYWQHPK